MIGIVFSEKDMAANTMFPFFIEHGFQEYRSNIWKMDDIFLIRIGQDIIFPKELDVFAEQLNLEYIVMASRHKSKSEKPTLTVHATGNFGDADFGGRPKELQLTIANPMRNVYLEMRNCTLDYTVSREATHHGPTEFNVPLFFAELGSSEKQWKDEEAASFLVDCIIKGIRKNKKAEVAIAFGGGHYCPKFSEMNEIAFGHIAAKYAVDLLDEALVKQMVDKTYEHVDFAILDEKGLKGRQKTHIKSLLSEIGIEY
ncbi:MAG: D-aminoacyl-tRNA deacylase [Candidatus Diapherotrites archaeon]|nr:D-aminoacyl-tRNA deacylase [Candidatus Diapherotrites archaeon]